MVVMVERLLKARANPNAAQMSGLTPLMIAAHTGNVDVVKLLLAHGANVNAATTETGNTALMWAVSDRHADIVKVFPATALGPQFIKDVRAPLPQLKLMPTGGVSLDNAHDWIRAGAVAVGIGSALLDAKAIEDGRFDAITANARRVVANVASAR